MVGVKSGAFPFLILIYTKMYLTMYRKCNFIENIIINNVGFRQQAHWNVHAFYVIPENKVKLVKYTNSGR